MASNASCYTPDGTLVTTWQPCNSTDDGRVSACCELSSSVCTTTGLCVGSGEYFYRGGCTDPSWRSLSCPDQCATARKFSFANLYPCVTGLPDPDRLFCCGVDKNCCTENFTMSGGVPFAPALVQKSDNNASSLSLSISSSSSPNSAFTSAVVSSTPISTSTLCADHSNGPSTVTVGSAVGASLGGLLLAFLILFIFRERHWRNKAHYIQMESEKRAWELQQLNGKVGATENAYPVYGNPSEMPTDRYLMAEAPTMTDPQEVSGHSSLPKRTVV